MAEIARAAARHYPISDIWLATADNAPDYVDFKEIVEKNSAYVDWVIANDPGIAIPGNVDSHAQACNFIPNGIRVGETSRGPDITGRLLGDTYTDKGKYAGGIDHPERYGRIYRSGTTARHLWLLGLDANL